MRACNSKDAPQQADRPSQSALVDAFLAAARDGDFDALLALLDPDVVVRARRRQTRLLDGAPAAVWMPGGQPRVVYAFTTSGGKIIAIDLIADAERLQQINLVILDQ